MDLTEEQVDEWFRKLREYLDENNALKLRELSNKLIEEAVTSKDKRIVTMSFIAYGLAKLASKPHFEKLEKWPEFKSHVIKHLREEEKKPTTRIELDSILKKIIKDVTDFDKEAGRYVFDIIEKARVKQGSRLYAMGASLSRSATVTGADETELLRYIGTTKIHDLPYTKSKGIVQRYSAAKKALDEGK